MFLSYFTLLVALSLSAVAAWYSIIGLTAIFAAAVIPIIIMGGILEVAKLTATVWLHEHWARCRWLMKSYLVSAVLILMVITSMGIFGFLSRAHIEQSAPIGDTAAQIEIIEEKIEIEQQVIAQYRQDLAILNQQIERFSELGAVTRGVNARATQQAERETIFDQIAQSQSTITDLRQQRAPLSADIRKIETEVGPIKYIAALIYGDNPDQNLLEKAVRWVIILLVVVFDPLAIMLLLAATESLRWRRDSAPAYEPDDGPLTEPQLEEIQAAVDAAYEPDDGPLTDQQLEEIQAAVDEWERDNQSINKTVPTATQETVLPNSVPATESEKSILEQHPYLDKEFAHFEPMLPMVAPEPEQPAAEIVELEPEQPVAEIVEPDPLPESPTSKVYFGAQLPDTAQRGDQYVLTGTMPTVLYKHNGHKWVSVDKNTSDSYTYNQAYIEYLVQKIATGEYDPELLTDAERTQIETHLRSEK